MLKETLRLFGAIQYKEGAAICSDMRYPQTVKHGFIFDARAASSIDDECLKIIISTYGLDGERMNNAFHKNWETIQNTPQEELWFQAICHYASTYGAGLEAGHSEEEMYIPNEVLELPSTSSQMSLKIVKGLTKDEIIDKIMKLAGSGVALNEQTLRDIMVIIEENKYDSEFVSKVKNRELTARLRTFYNIVPTDPTDFLRYLVEKITEESLLIKNSYLIKKIKNADNKLTQRVLDAELKKAPKNLAEIFNRYKPLFLALKSISKNKTFFNRLRKDATKMHKPLGEDFLNTITGKIKNGEEIHGLVKALENYSVFRKIRLAYALKQRLTNSRSIMYRVRNGKGFAKDFDFPIKKETFDIYEQVINSIVENIRPNVEGKKFFLPEGIEYTIPATEKKFVGNIPDGSYVEVDEDMVFGIHWFNTNKTVDLDLSVIDKDGKTGWDSNYSSDDSNVLFSGDITSAPKPKGAAELFYIKQSAKNPKLAMVNFYNFNKGDEVDCRIIAAKEKVDNFGSNYMVDVSNIIMDATVNFNKKQNIIGLVAKVEDKNRFYFSNVSVGNSISSGGKDYVTHVREFLFNSIKATIGLREVFKLAGAEFVSEPGEGVVDLSPEKLDKTTIINFLTQ